MAGNIKVNAVQLGDSATDSQNFVIKTNADGTGKLARGAAGNLGDVVSWTASGQISFPGSVIASTGPCFGAYQSTGQAIPAGAATKLQFQTEEFDAGNCFDTAASRFTPTVAGYYLISVSMLIPSASRTTEAQLFLYKNGSVFKSAIDSGSGMVIIGMTSLVYLNGATDFVEGYTYLATGATTTASSIYNCFQAHLARSA